MEDSKLLQCALSSETEQLLNQQIALEGTSSAQYLAMASWADTQGYKGAAKFLYHHAEEERAHMLKIVHYVNDAGGHGLQPDIKGIRHTFASLKAMFQFILAHEVKVTKAIHQLVAHCLATQDFATFNFLQWFLAEQIEEEVLARRALELFKVIGEEGIGLYTIDKEIGALQDGVPNEA